MRTSNTSYDVVWSMKVPDVCTGRWNDNDWIEFSKRFRPTGYRGDMFDREAYEEYKEVATQAMRDGKLSPFMEI